MAFPRRITCKRDNLPYLPLSLHLKDGDEVVLQDYSEDFAESVYSLIQCVVNEGKYVPEVTFDEDDFKSYHLARRMFVLRTSSNGDLVGIVYMGSFGTSQNCNGGFMVSHGFRDKGAMQLLVKSYLRIARDLGHTGCVIKMVFVSNQPAMHVYKKLGFKQVGLVPKAGDLEGLGLVDAANFYYDLTVLDENGVPPGGWTVPS